MESLGTDITDMFINVGHSATAENMLEDYYVCNLNDNIINDNKDLDDNSKNNNNLNGSNRFMNGYKYYFIAGIVVLIAIVIYFLSKDKKKKD
ncbi:cytochrome b5 type B-like protein [Spraguea lophii 42_110]|uniref:Cytochrome b5 type B-like protein n=1 Tax=Spraguea lophii (strain 42_110) TaxID=1358809 RepID=S7W6H5_SPRLO|nr:cytochrome b5 type B-like protein [Spraguea lophii 42_110]